MFKVVSPLIFLVLLTTSLSYGQQPGFGNATSIQNYPVSSTAPASGQCLTYNGTNIVWGSCAGTGGTGTVTNVSGLSPLFTVSTPTTTPTFALSDAAADTVFGNCTAGSTTPSYCSIVAAMLPTFGTSAAGIVPASGGGTTNFLRADGSWAAPSGGGGGPPLGAAGQVPIMNAGATAYAPVTLSQDCTVTSAGVVTCLKTNNVAFTAAATTAIGTSGATLPLLSTANTWTLGQTYSALLTASAGIALPSGQAIAWNSDTGISRGASGTVYVGSGAAASAAGNIAATNLYVLLSGNLLSGLTTTGTGLASTLGVYWSSGASFNGTRDTSLCRSGAGVLEVGTSTTCNANGTFNAASYQVAGTGPTGTGALVEAGSPALTGTPTAPTATVGTNTTQIATTAFVLANAGGLWSAIGNPTGNLALTMGADTSTFTYNATTSTSDLFKLTDTTNNTGTGIMLHITTASGSTEIPFQADANGVGWEIDASGNLKNVGSSSSGSISVSGAASGTAIITVQSAAGTPTVTLGTNSGTPAVTASSPLTINTATGNITINANGITATQLAAQYSKGSCTELWGGSGTSFALTSGDDAISNNSCYNDSGVTRTITAVKCRSDIASSTTTVNPTFGSAGTGTTILSGALTCGSSLAYSSSGTVTNASWTTGTGINPVMGGTLTGTSIAVIVEYTF